MLHPCDGSTAWRDNGDCFVDGEWFRETADGWVESDEPEPQAQATEPEPEPEAAAPERADRTEQQSEFVYGWLHDSGAERDEDVPDPWSDESYFDQPDEVVIPEPVPEPEATDPQPKVTTPEPEPEATEPGPEVNDPEQEAEATLPQPEPGDTDLGQEPVRYEGEPDQEAVALEPLAPQPGAWVPPQAGMVPPTFPVCELPPYGENCLPPSEWHVVDEVNWEIRPLEVPRRTAQIAEWHEWCLGQIPGATCVTLLGNAKWALDYLGAHPSCVLSEYYDRVVALQSGRSETSSIDDTSGWHNCATVIDPLLPDPPDGRATDIGHRLSDTGLSLADRCRAVLPSDVQLETGRTIKGFVGDPPTPELNPATVFAAGHAGCDDWATYVAGMRSVSRFPQCGASAQLAEEWMEHHYGVPNTYFAPWC
ncbi:MAG: hypothetical protein F4118_11315 [Acidimicrobiaceae bacterium]|nr:hypothetical protein [Acidimicrobiaceae bacterium]MYI36996.1 hypothetical protein [Acidimicrobiaceae bacterium]